MLKRMRNAPKDTNNQLDRMQLLAALKTVNPGIDGKAVFLEGSDAFIFDNEWIRTYNDYLSVSYPFISRVKCAIKAQEFYEVLLRMSGDNISLVLSDKLVISDSVTTLSMALVEEKVTGFINILGLDTSEEHILPEDFLDAVDKCLFVASVDESYGALCGIYVNGCDVLSSDNFRVSWYKMSDKILPMLIPSKACGELIKIKEVMGKLSKYSVSNSWVHFKSADGVVFSSRLLAMDYPYDAIKKYFIGDKGVEYTFPEGIEETLDRVGIMSTVENNFVEYIMLESDGETLVCESSRSSGTVVDKIKAGNLPNMKLRLSPKFLKLILSTTHSFYLLGGKLLLFETDKFSHLISTVEVG